MAEAQNTIIGSGKAPKLSFTKQGVPVVDGKELEGVVLSAPTTSYRADGFDIDIVNLSSSATRILFRAHAGVTMHSLAIVLANDAVPNLNAAGKEVIFQGFGENDKGRKLFLSIDAETITPNKLKVTDSFGLKLEASDKVTFAPGPDLRIQFSNKDHHQSIGSLFDVAMEKASVLGGMKATIRDNLAKELECAAVYAKNLSASFTSNHLPVGQCPVSDQQISR